MLGDERRLEALDQPCQPLEMRGVEPLGAAEREPDAVDRQRIVGAQPLQAPHGRSAAHVVLGVDFQPGDARAGRHDFGDMGGAQADTAAGRMHGALWTRDRRRAVRDPGRPAEVS